MIYTVLIVLFTNDSAMGIPYTSQGQCIAALSETPFEMAERFSTTVLEAYCVEATE